MRFWAGVTDPNWFEFLSHLQPDEVNFWQPRGRPPFVNLPTGAPFLFKLKRSNYIVGGGCFVKFSVLPLSIAWDAFGMKNGAASKGEFQAMIGGLTGNPDNDPSIGCTVLTEPVFWPRERWIQDPPGFRSPTQVGRYYDTDTPDGAQLWSEVEVRNASSVAMVREATPRYGEPVLVSPRLGQGAFRVVVTDAYERRCAITGERTLPVLEAAHILPFAENGPNEASNGMLLRSDFHKLFDIGLVTVTPEYRVQVSLRIQQDWFNGAAYYRLDGQPLASVPKDPSQRPEGALLSWHNRNRFQGNAA